jgi:cell division protein ZapA
MAATTVTVRILDREYQVACPPEEVDELTASARHLDRQMRTIRESGKVLGLDRMAVMAALNIAHEYLRLQNTQATSTRTSGEMERRIGELLARVSAVITELRSASV